MMEFWPENQGQSHLYSKFGTVPGRNYTHNYHDRHQAAHYPLYYGEQQQDQARESIYWTVPGSRTGGAQHEYSNWNNAELGFPSSSHFPFILDRQSSHHQNLGEYQPHDTREWAAAHRSARDNERAFLRDGWRRWEPCNPARYNREVSAKRSDSSYRELEAWAARYSHSLPRRRHTEAELREASQGLLGSRRSGTDHQVATVRQAQHPANIRDSGLWDRGTRKQALHQSLSHAPDTRKVLDVKVNTDYQRKVFSQPPCYIAPPPYNSPHKCSPVTQQCDPSWGQDIRRQTLWSQPTVRKEDVAAHKRKGEKDAFIMSNESKDNTKLEGLTHQREEVESSQAGSTLSVQNMHTGHEPTLFLQQPQVNQSSGLTEETSSKVIEGRKFKINKRMGGMTIFCLVSRIAGTTENPSLPVYGSQTTIRRRETGELSEGLMDSAQVNPTHKLADEVDFTVPTLTEELNTSDVRTAKGEIKETGPDNPGDPLPNTTDENAVFQDQAVPSDACIFVKQSVQPVSAKYPLWREPSFTSRAENSSTSCVEETAEEEESDGAQDRQGCSHVSGHPIDIEVRRLDIKENSESQGLLVIDTTCVVVKMELIQSPKKEHIHYMGSTAHTEDNTFNVETLQSLDLNNQQNLDVTNIENTQSNASPTNDSPETDLDSTLLEKEERKFLLPCMLTPRIYERAERILGISLKDCMNEHQPEDEMSNTDAGVERQGEICLIKNDIDDGANEPQGDTMEEEHTKSCLELIQTEDAENMTENNIDRDHGVLKEEEDFPENQQPVSDKSDNDETDCCHVIDLRGPTESEMTQDCPLESTAEQDKCDQNKEVNWPIDGDRCSQPHDLFNLLSHSPFNVESWPCVSDSNAEGRPDPETSPVTTTHHDTLSFLQPPLQQSQSLLPNTSHESSPNSPDQTDRWQNPSSLDLLHQTAKPVSDTNGCDEEEESEMNSDDLAINITDEVVSPQQCDRGNVGNAANVTNGQNTKQGDEDKANVLEETLATSEKKNIDAVILEQCESLQTEAVPSANEMNVTEQQPPEQDRVGHSSLSVQSEEEGGEEGEEKEEEKEKAEEQQGEQEEHESNFQSETDLFCAKESGRIEDQSKNEAETELLSSFPSSASDYKVESEESSAELHSPPHKCHESATELVPPVDSGSLHHSLDPNTAAASQTVPLHLYLDSSEESIQVPSSSPDSAPILPPSSAPPPQDEGGSHKFHPSVAHKQELRYPRSLWDVVNRIRKHTAPDSENEEEEMSEPWDPETVGEELGGPGALVNSDRIVFDEAEQQEVSTDYVDVGQILQCGKSSNERADDDTLSCSSTSSHGSGGTVIEADEDEDEETMPNAISESTSEVNEEFITTEEVCCCGDTAAGGNKEGPDQADATETERNVSPVERNGAE